MVVEALVEAFDHFYCKNVNIIGVVWRNFDWQNPYRSKFPFLIQISLYNSYNIYILAVKMIESFDQSFDNHTTKVLS